MQERTADADPAAIAAGPQAGVRQPIRLGAIASPGAIAVLAGIGLLLRWRAAQTDLWLDEIWSLQLVGPLTSAGQIFWRLSHDNNHYFNSLWLYWAGPDRSAEVYRGPAIAYGVLSVLMAARIGFRRSRSTGLAAAGLTAASPLLVNYGSEARGYGGLILALFVAIDAFDISLGMAAQAGRRGVGAPARWARWRLRLAIGVGSLFHATMAALLPVLAIAATIRLMGAGYRFRAALAAATSMLAPSVLLLLPLVAAVLAGLLVQGHITVGGTSPFGTQSIATGYGGLLASVVGVPEEVPLAAVLAASGIGLALALYRRMLSPSLEALAMAGLAIGPACLAASRLPNLEYPRYFMASGVIALLVLAECVGCLWDRDGIAARSLGALVLAACLAGQAAADRSLIRLGRGSPSALVTAMGSEGRPAVYASNSRFKTETELAYVAARRQIRLTYVAPGDFCDLRPDWYVVAGQDPSTCPDAVTIGPPSCPAEFVKRAAFPASRLSGLSFALYRRAASEPLEAAGRTGGP